VHGRWRKVDKFEMCFESKRKRICYWIKWQGKRRIEDKFLALDFGSSVGNDIMCPDEDVLGVSRFTERIKDLRNL
jgi:hypothetical protein